MTLTPPSTTGLTTAPIAAGSATDLRQRPPPGAIAPGGQIPHPGAADSNRTPSVTPTHLLAPSGTSSLIPTRSPIGLQQLPTKGKKLGKSNVLESNVLDQLVGARASPVPEQRAAAEAVLAALNDGTVKSVIPSFLLPQDTFQAQDTCQGRVSFTCAGQHYAVNLNLRIVEDAVFLTSVRAVKVAQPLQQADMPSAKRTRQMADDPDPDPDTDPAGPGQAKPERKKAKPYKSQALQAEGKRQLRARRHSQVDTRRTARSRDASRRPVRFLGGLCAVAARYQGEIICGWQPRDSLRSLSQVPGRTAKFTVGMVDTEVQ